MSKNIYNYQNKKEWNASGEAEANKTEKTIMNISTWVGFIGCALVLILYNMKIIHFYWFFVFLAIPFIPLVIFIIRHFVIKKDYNAHSESYNIKGSYNGITDKDNTEITDYEYKEIKNNDKNNEGD